MSVRMSKRARRMSRSRRAYLLRRNEGRKEQEQEDREGVHGCR